jgi:triacylglycerol lipase
VAGKVSIAYHSNCCPLLAKEASQLILAAYKLYYDSRMENEVPDCLVLESGTYRLIRVFKAKVLPLSRYKVLGFIAVRDDCVYLIFRGTESISEWVGDSRFVQVKFLDGWGKVHKGFRQIYKSCSKELLSTLSDLEGDHSRLCIAGHSLGGAISTLACADILEQTSFQSPVHYTFASPRVGDLAFARQFQERVPASYRILNTEDIVITEPKAATIGTICQYAHIGIPLAFSHHGGSLLDNHLLESYMNYL